MNKKNVYPLDFGNPERYTKLIMNLFPNSTLEKREFSYHVILEPKNRIIIYFDNSGHITLDLNPCKTKEEMYSKLVERFFLRENEKGKYVLPKTWKLYSPKLSRQLKCQLLEQFRNKIKDTRNTPNQHFVLSIKGKNSLVHMKNGNLTLQGPNQNKITDIIYKFVDKFINDNIKINKRNFEEVIVKKEPYSSFIRNNIGINLVKNLDECVYNYLSGRDICEIEDGLKIYAMIKEKEIKLHNYKSLVRCFSVAFEGFLIKFFLDIGYINKDEYMQDPRTAKIFKYINNLRKDYGEIIDRTNKGLISKLSNIWNECRNNYLHSDMYSYSQLLNLQQAEAKIIEIFMTMKQVLYVLPIINGERYNEN